MPRLILCSDDFAFSREISETIVDLALKGKVNAISCMAALPGWADDSILLRKLPSHVQIGLHLTLTNEAPLTAMPSLAPKGALPDINSLARLSRGGALPVAEIECEVRAQFDAFTEAFKQAPAFVDGHQHAHALKGVRDLVLKETVARAPAAWIRNSSDTLFSMLARPFAAKAVASAFHARGFRQLAASYGVSTNDSFAGHYDFKGDYRSLFPRFLDFPGTVHLVMCHPGAGHRGGDGIAAARIREADALREWSIVDMAAAGGLSFPH